MKKAYLVTMTILFVLSVSAASAVVTVPYDCGEFVRGTGGPVVQTIEGIPGIPGTIGTLRVINGANDDTLEKVSSSVIMFNGINVLSQGDFNQNVSELTVEVSLQETNTISVELWGKPGGGIRIELIQEIEADAAAIIGPEGGKLETPSGGIVEIPSGALEKKVTISITELHDTNIPFVTVSNVYSVGGFDIKPNGIAYSCPVHVIIPMSKSMPSGTAVPILLLNEELESYMFETEGVVNADENTVSFFINHNSKRYLPITFTDQDEQNRLKNSILSVVEEFINKYECTCFFKNNFLTLGYIEKIKERLFDWDVEIFINEDFLNEYGNEAMYVDRNVANLYFNDIIIADDPDKIDRETLYHEVLHAIFDKYDSELKNLGVPDDEAITSYLDYVATDSSGYLDMMLVKVDELYRSGESCDFDSVLIFLNTFVTKANEELQNPGNGQYPTITDQALDYVREISGFYVDPEYIRIRYIIGDCGICGVYSFDTDGDCIFDDGDFSGTAGDNKCYGGLTDNCDDNCPDTYNPDQADSDGNGIGDACETSTLEKIVIDFEELSQPGTGNFFIGSEYIYKDFNLTAFTSTNHDDFAEFCAWQTDRINILDHTGYYLDYYPGSTALINNFWVGDTVLKNNNGALFNLISIDISEYNSYENNSYRCITFRGKKEDSSIVYNTFCTDGYFGIETFKFSGFDNLLNVSWVGYSTQFDNITLEIK